MNESLYVLNRRKLTNQAPQDTTRNSFEVSERPSEGDSETDTVVMQVKKMIPPTWKFVRKLLLFCSEGALCGAAIGFLMYLHLGPFKSAEDAGFAAGLFLKSGVQLGFIAWMIHVLALALRRWVFGSPKQSS